MIKLVKQNDDGTFTVYKKGDNVTVTVVGKGVTQESETTYNEDGEAITTIKDVEIDINEEININTSSMTFEELSAYNIFEVVPQDYDIELQTIKNSTYTISAGKAIESLVLEYKDIDTVKSILRVRIDKDFKTSIALLDKSLPEEKESWFAQVKEAENPTAPTPLIDAIVSSRVKYTKDELVSAILAKSAQYSSAYGTILGEYQRKKDIVDSAIDVDGLVGVL